MMSGREARSAGRVLLLPIAQKKISERDRFGAALTPASLKSKMLSKKKIRGK
jgi:hypothetical protein